MPSGCGIVSTSLTSFCKSLMLAYFEGMTYTQVAGRMGAPLSTVKSWIWRSLIRLKDCMER